MDILTYLKKILRKKSKVIVICGPTATGKTSLSITIAKEYNGEIISADSRQVYRGLDIGSAKVTLEEMDTIPHHMIDVAEPKDRYSVQEFVTEAQTKISEIISRGNIPIVCGGTGQYIDALVFNQSFPEVAPNNTLRNQLEKLSVYELYNQLKEKDPIRALSIDKQNKVRLIRALEIIGALGVVPKQEQSSPYDVLFIGLDIKNEILHQRIRVRISDRFEHQHMLEEAKALYKRGLPYARMEELGLEYRFMARYLQNKITYPEMIEQLNTATRQFVKRQRTWFKRNRQIQWFNITIDQNKILQLVQKFIK